ISLLVLTSTAWAAPPPGKGKDNDTQVQLLAINDFHGHLEPNTPGTIRYCCERDTNPAVNRDVVVTRLAGGVEYLGTLVKSLRDRNSNTLTVSAGDTIGASPLLSGLFHDEPAIEALNALGLQVNGVGNHEFDEGLAELYRMQNGGCTSDATTCALSRNALGPQFGGALFQYLAANVFMTGSTTPILPPYQIEKVDNAKIAFIGLTFENTPTVVTPTAVAGLEFKPEIPVVNALVHKLRDEEGVRAFVILLHQGGIQSAPFSNAGRYPEAATGFADVNACDHLQGDIDPIVKGLDPMVDVVVSAHTHQPYVCPDYAGTNILLTSASSFGRLVTSIDLTIDHQTKDISAKTATNYVVKQTSGPFNSATGSTNLLGAPIAKDATESAIVQKWQSLSAPIANRIIGHLTADILSSRDGTAGSNFAGEQPVGEVIADGQLAAGSSGDFGGAQIAFMNPGGIRGGLKFAPGPGETRAAGQITFSNAFTVQPFSNVMQVKTMTGGMIYRLLEQQWSGLNAGTNRKILQVSNGFTYSYDLTLPGNKVIPGTVKLNGTAIDPLASYQVTMNNFLGDGGDNFSVFKEGSNTIGGQVDLDAFVAYLTAHDPVPTPPMNRITRLG
ncbi:MAG: bifunctional metallophosphatase/5'-nucleotidase, partial [Gaiellaceae bacterium]